MTIFRKIAMIALIAPAVLLLEAASAFAAIHYSRVPTGDSGSSFTVNFSFDDFTTDVCGGDCGGLEYYQLRIKGRSPQYNYDTAAIPSSTQIYSLSVTQLEIPSTGIAGVFVTPVDQPVENAGEAVSLEGNGGTIFFTFTSAANVIKVPTNLTADLSQNTGDQLGDQGTLFVLGVVAGVYIVFYVMRELVGLVPRKGKNP